ncbi:MAG: LamG domain-containing protein [Candidatus Omnitrophota bacterium]
MLLSSTAGIFRPYLFGEESKQAGDKDALFYLPFDGNGDPAIAKGDKGFTIVGKPTFTEGKAGKAAVLSSVDWFNYKTDGNISSAAGTLEMWLQPVDWHKDDNEYHHFLRLYGGSWDVILYKHGESPSIYFYQGPSAQTKRTIAVGFMGKKWVPDVWHHVAVTWSDKGAAVYMDGKLSGEVPLAIPLPPDDLTKGSMFIGGTYFVPNDTKTVVDELRIYSRVLSAEEIAAHYEALK